VAVKRGGPLKRTTPLRAKAGPKRKPVPKQKAARYTGPSAKLRKAVLERDQFHCQRCGRAIGSGPYALQHRLPRGRRTIDANVMANLVTLCGDATNPDYCHSHVESFRLRAVRDGWLVPSGIDPAGWPVKRFGQMWSMPGEDWTECEPHPDQETWGLAA
jgi:hypothetical protein